MNASLRSIAVLCSTQFVFSCGSVLSAPPIEPAQMEQYYTSGKVTAYRIFVNKTDKIRSQILDLQSQISRSMAYENDYESDFPERIPVDTRRELAISERSRLEREKRERLEPIVENLRQELDQLNQQHISWIAPSLPVLSSEVGQIGVLKKHSRKADDAENAMQFKTIVVVSDDSIIAASKHATLYVKSLPKTAIYNVGETLVLEVPVIVERPTLSVQLPADAKLDGIRTVRTLRCLSEDEINSLHKYIERQPPIIPMEVSR